MDNELQLKIEAYLGNNLSHEACDAFEAEMENNPELREAVNLSRQLNLFLKDEQLNESAPKNQYAQDLKKIINSDEATAIKKNLKQLNDLYKTPEKPKRKNYLLIAASIAIFMVSSISFLMFNNTSTDELYASYYNETDIPSILKRNANNSKLNQGVIAFKNKNYKEATNLFNSYIKTDSSTINTSVYIYSGLSYLQQNNFEQAEQEFNKIINSNALDNIKGLWFKGLLFLKKGDKAKAKLIFEEIGKNPNGFKSKEAKEILSNL